VLRNARLMFVARTFCPTSTIPTGSISRFCGPFHVEQIPAKASNPAMLLRLYLAIVVAHARSLGTRA